MVTRPLLGEPLAVDLLNTRWRTADGEADLLATTDGFAQWLAEAGLDDLTPTDAARIAALEARAAIRSMLADGAHPDGADGSTAQSAAEGALNAILARGLAVRSISSGVIRERIVFTDPEWTAAWRAATSYVDLRRQAPDAIRQCRHPDCVLHFFDPTGRRRWCSMAGCGNRAKAKRHYHRTRVTPAGSATGGGPGRDSE